MKEKCYITSTRTTHKNRKNEIIGPCGPCSFINLTKAKGSFEFEKRLAEMGRLKPFHASGYTAFLIWADKFKKDLKIFTASRKINDKRFSLMIRYENVPKEKIKKYKEIARERHEQIDKKFSNRIATLKNPLQKINELLEQGYRVAVLNSSFYFDKISVPHWIVAFRRNKNKYWFCDSANGIISLTKNQLEKGWKINRKEGFSEQLVAYKE
jgi:hypothetical protein